MIRTYKKPVIQEVEDKIKDVTSVKKTGKPTQPAPLPDYIIVQVLIRLTVVIQYTFLYFDLYFEVYLIDKFVDVINYRFVSPLQQFI